MSSNKKLFCHPKCGQNEKKRNQTSAIGLRLVRYAAAAKCVGVRSKTCLLYELIVRYRGIARRFIECEILTKMSD